MPDQTDDRRRDPLLLFALSCALALGWLMVGMVTAETVTDIFAESGPIEQTSALFLLLSALALGVEMVRRRDWGRWHLAVLVLAAGLRELDWDKAFTGSGILQLRLYSGDGPLAHKIAGAAVVILLVWAGLRLLRRNLPDWLRALRGRDVWAWLMLAALALYGVAKSLDGLGRKLAPWGIEISDWANRTAGRSEEAMELFGAILILQVVGLSLIRRAATPKLRTPEPRTIKPRPPEPRSAAPSGAATEGARRRGRQT
ncbi:hypothetical protein E4191_13250 [Paracoccus liaowanqingii]|uniref:Uncharacterized protein n=1 Tax=Paracoccus liaowanqingii TaxID=2560053 RepID=A0A4P7HPB8_9RHOB|nr:hypothetical protein [Paracoccus liaowanqingii]QBX35553.1 hypothetical protein E4191_13250 [Paracoccus liaowanqingii]